MTCPTPILTSKSPRPTEESNLRLFSIEYRMEDLAGRNALLALAIGSAGVLEPAGVLHGDVVAVLGLGDAVAGRDQSLGDTHVC